MDNEIMDGYIKQMVENHAKKIDTNFWLIIKQKPKWMPSFLYKAVIKQLVEFHHYQGATPPPQSVLK